MLSLTEKLIIYLRKSRADNPDESVEEVLLKHYNILQDFCEREYGFRIPEENIYREVVSGESIDERIEIKKVLSLVEAGEVDCVIVVEPQRLSRGDLIDCGRLIDTFRYSNTQIITPMMTYNLDNKMERRFFQDELMRGRDYLEYTKEILNRGRIAAVKRGCFIMSVAPYGYDKIKIGKDYTLVPNDDAETVKMIFRMYADGQTPNAIANKLNEMHIPSPQIHSDRWELNTIRKILKNQHYIGKVFYQKRAVTTKIVDGRKVQTRPQQKDYLIAEGKHQAIIDDDLFELCQERFSKNPPRRTDLKFNNKYAGIIFCAKCGKPIQMTSSRNRNNFYRCNTVGCSKNIIPSELDNIVIQTLQQVELPNLIAKFKNGDGNAVEVRKRQMKKLQAELNQLEEQEAYQYELLETKKYTQAVFDKRNKIIREKMTKLNAQYEELKKSLPEVTDFEERIQTLQEAIDCIGNDGLSIEAKNKLLTAIIERIDILSEHTEKKYEHNYSIKIKLRI